MSRVSASNELELIENPDVDTPRVEARLLVVDDEENVSFTVSEVLKLEGYVVDTASSGDEAISRLSSTEYDLVLTDLHMESGDGLSVLTEIRRAYPNTIAIVLTGFASIESAIGAMRQGAYDYLIKPCIIDDLKLTVRRGIEHRHLKLAEIEARNRLEELNRDLERRVDERTGELKKVNEELTAANRSKDIFFATLSHELRTPLTPVLGWVKLLNSGNRDPGLLNQGLEAIERNAKLQARLIDDLLDISRIVSGKLRIDREPIDLNKIVGASVETVRHLADSKGVTLDVSLSILPLVVQGAAVRLQQIVWNLLSNAIKFTDPGGRVSISVEQRDGMAEVIVKDTGIGISKDFLPHVFDLFRQADGSPTRQYGGLGLGLAIVQALARLHNGFVVAESKGKGKGAVFTFGVPCTVAESEEKPPTPKGSKLNISRPVLVVEDSPDTLTLLQMMLSQQGCKVLTASSAAEAMNVVAKETPGIIISDIGMPGIDGYQLLQEIRRRPGMEQIPAIAITGYAMEEDRQKSIESGFTAHMAKPVDPGELISLVSQLTS